MSAHGRRRRARLAGAAAAAILLVVPAGLVLAHQRDAQEFPHPRHAGLFPLCTGCHTGIPQGDEAAYYPDAELCARCHDGVNEEEVTWTGPDRERTNLTFSHPEHFSETDREGLEVTCARCHSEPGAPRMTVVERAEPATCFECHTHEAQSHFVDADCSVCHVPLVGAPFDRARIADLPEPEDHDVQGFLAEGGHGELAEEGVERCSVCHTRDLCTSCHVDAGRAPIQALAPAPAGMELPIFRASYPEPASHASPAWLEDHGGQATTDACGTCHTQQDCAACHVGPLPAVARTLVDRSETATPGVGLRPFQASYPEPASHASPTWLEDHAGRASADACGTCHTRQDCASCHVAPLPAVALTLVDRSETEAPGVGLRRRMPASHATPFFTRAHAAEAASAQDACATCHTPTFCTDCHDAPAASAGETLEEGDARPVQGLHDRGPGDLREGGFHPPDFMMQHASDAYGRTLECSNCHNTTVFCRSCHVEAGFRTQGRLGPGFHDGQPVWLLRHGQAARQSLESCTTCHTQRDCLQCHSTIGAFRVNPHTRDFDARRAWEANPAICFACHIRNPFEGGGEIP